MTYMQNNDVFARSVTEAGTDSRIRELSINELDDVSGGPIPIVVAYYSIGIVGTLYAGAQAGLAAMRLGYAANKQ